MRLGKRSARIVKFASDELGLTLTEAQAEMLSSFELGEYSTAVWQCGRRGGKSLLSDVLALYDVAVRDQLRVRMRPGELRIAAIVCPRQEQASAHIRNCRLLLEHSQRLRHLLAQETGDTLTFQNGSAIVAYPCSARGIRGAAWSSAILDELAHFVDTDTGPAAGDRILEAAWPALSQFGRDGWLIAISTPRWRQGAFWRLSQDAESGRFPQMHFRHLATAEMNPSIPSDFLDDQRRRDPELFAREFQAEFIAGAGIYLDPDQIVAAQRREGVLAPSASQRYYGAIDPGYQVDAFTLAIAHRDEQGRAVVDGCWAWRRSGHEATLDAVVQLAKQYRVRELKTDQHSAVPIREGLLKRGLDTIYAPWTSESKASAFARLKVALATESVELPNDAALVEELCNLEARPTPGGYTRIAAAGSGHDDRAVVVAAVVESAIGKGDVSDQVFAASFGLTVCPRCLHQYTWRDDRECPNCGAQSGGSPEEVLGLSELAAEEDEREPVGAWSVNTIMAADERPKYCQHGLTWCGECGYGPGTRK